MRQALAWGHTKGVGKDARRGARRDARARAPPRRSHVNRRATTGRSGWRSTGRRRHVEVTAKASAGAREVDARASELAGVLLELGLEALEEREGVRRAPGEADEDVLPDLPHLLRVGLDDDGPHADLPVADHADLAAPPHAQDRRPVHLRRGPEPPPQQRPPPRGEQPQAPRRHEHHRPHRHATDNSALRLEERSFCPTLPRRGLGAGGVRTLPRESPPRESPCGGDSRGEGRTT